MFQFDLGPALKDLRAEMKGLQRDQIPFVNALALTKIAQTVQAAETRALPAVLDRPTPFTLKAFAIVPARKSSPTATVFAKDIQAAYLAPTETGGLQRLGSKRAILAPRGVALNSYGNLPKSKLATLKAKPTVFVGKVTTKKGAIVSGVWQRAGGKKASRLKLLVQFEDPKDIKPVLGYQRRAKSVIEGCYVQAYEAAWARAMATAQ